MTNKIALLPIVAALAACSASVSKDSAAPEPDDSQNTAVVKPASVTEPAPSVDPVVAERMNMQMATHRVVYTDRDPFVEPTLSEACGWEGPTMYFSTDSAKLGLVADVKVEALATCLKQDALRDEPVIVVGYADERGDEYYNLELGLERANKVKKALVGEGVSADRVETYSRGEYMDDPDDALQADRRALVKLDR